MTKLIEPVAQSVLTILRTGMPAVITKINNEYAAAGTQADATNLDIQANSGYIPLGQIESYYFGERLQIAAFPCIMVEPLGSTIDPERFHFQWADYDHKVAVDVLVVSDSEDAIARQVLRYSRAIWEVLFGNQTDATGGITQAISLKPVRGMNSPLVVKDSLYLRGWRWELEVHRYDDLT